MGSFPNVTPVDYPSSSTLSYVIDSMPHPRVRRTSSAVGDDLRGDNAAAALSTLEPNPIAESPPASPLVRPRERPEHQEEPQPEPPRRRRRRPRNYYQRWKDFTLRHTWVNPLVVISIVLVLYGIRPGPTNPLHSALFLSYPLSSDDPLIPAAVRANLDAPTHYGKGGKDFAFVAFYVVVLSFAREFIMQRALRPIARFCQITSRSKQNRFLEQTYSAIYFGIFGPYGLYVMYHSPVWYFDTVGMYQTFPNRTHEAAFKAYYLLEAAYWSQQALVLSLMLEKPRKDFRELVGHHIVTLALIWLSYRFHFTYMGLAVYITHDVSDFFLATSKTLSYLNSRFVSTYFGIFIAVWVYLRHYINLVILYSITTTFTTVGPYVLNWETQQYKCWISQYITFLLLAALQAMNIFWLYYIGKVAVKVMRGGAKKDDRSDDEEEEDDDDVHAKEEVKERRKERREIRGEQEQGLVDQQLKSELNGQVVESAATPNGDIKKRR